MDAAEAFRKAYFAALKSVPGFKVLVIDSQTEETLSQLIQNSVNVNLGVSATMRIETLDNVQGAAMPWTNCVVIASSTDQNIQKLCNELRNQHFGDLHVYLTTRPAPEQLETLAREDKKERIRCLRILFTFFHPEYPDMFYSINMSSYNAIINIDPTVDDPKNVKVNRITKHNDITPAEALYYEAESLLSALRAIGRMPYCVRHTNTPTTFEFVKQLDKSVGNDGKWSGFKFDSRGMPPPGSVDSPTVPFELIIMDRKDDVLTPMLTDFTLTGILREIGGLRGGIVHFMIDGKEQQLPYNMLIDPTGSINELGAIPFPDVQSIIKKRINEFIAMINQSKDKGVNLNGPGNKDFNAVTAVQDALVKQDQIIKDKRLLTELSTMINKPTAITRNEKWTQWTFYTFKLALLSSKRKVNMGDKGKVDKNTKKAIKLMKQALADKEIATIAYAQIKIAFTFIAGFPEVVLKTGFRIGLQPAGPGAPQNTNENNYYDNDIRNGCVNIVRKFFNSKSLVELSNAESESIIDRFAHYSLHDYRGIDWNQIANHPLNKPKKVSKAADNAPAAESDGMFSLDFLSKEGNNKNGINNENNNNNNNTINSNLNSNNSEKKQDDTVPDWMFKYVPMSVSLATLAVRNEHRDLVPVFDHLTDKRVLESMNSKTKTIHDVLIYVVGGISTYEHIIQTPLGFERNPHSLADRERLGSLLTGHCILAGTSILTPKELISDVVGKHVE